MANAHSADIDQSLAQLLDQLLVSNPEIQSPAVAFSIDIRRLIVERASEPDSIAIDVVAAALAIVLRSYVKTLEDAR